MMNNKQLIRPYEKLKRSIFYINQKTKKFTSC